MYIFTAVDIPTEELKTRYFETLNAGYRRLIATQSNAVSVDREKLLLDCAFGVPSKTVSEFLSVAERASPLPHWALSLRNAVHEGEVNRSCGAEHVQKLQQPPQSLCDGEEMGETLLCSFDGDGDRVVFHFFEREQEVCL